MQSRFRKGVLEILTVCLTLAAAASAHSADFHFNFLVPPNGCEGGYCYNPTYIQGPFTLTSEPGPGQVLWRDSYPGQLTLSSGTNGYTNVSATMNFSEPVSSIDLDVSDLLDYSGFDTSQVLTPILVGGGDGTPVTIPFIADGVFRPISTISGGPYIGFRVQAQVADLLSWTNLKVSTGTGTGYPPDATHIRNVPTPAGAPVPVITLDAFKSTATEVVIAGTTEADFCVAPDPREVDVSPTKHNYVARQLQLTELIGKGTCAGGFTTDSHGYNNWSDLLTATGLRIDPWYRTFKSKFQGVTGYWIVVGVVRSSAQFKGPVVSAPFPDQLGVDYSPFNTVNGGQLPCATTVDKRPLTLSGTVPAFNEPANVEGNRMILDTILCDAGQAATRQSTHVYMMRMDRNLLSEAVNILNVLNGLNLTINQAASCVNTASKPAIAEMRRRVGTAALSILFRKWDSAIADLEQIARIAHNKVSQLPFTGCGDVLNYEGALMARALTGSFTVFDRFKHENASTWDMYTIPGDLHVPVLLTGGETE